jgi:putative ABC transport system substrate-binding protein
MRSLGYPEIRLEARAAAGRADVLAALAAELLALNVDVIVTDGGPAATAAKQATATIPIVIGAATTEFVMRQKLVESLARPGANVTGFTISTGAELYGKRLDLLKESIPNVYRVAVLWDPHAPGSIPQWQQSQLPARDLGLQLYSMEVSSADKFEAAFKAAIDARNDAVWVTLNPLANSNQRQIAELAIKNRLPTICARGDYAENGCLLAYGPGYSTEGKDGARYVDRILKGAKPADLPVEQPTRFDLGINLKTAKALGLAIPETSLVRADEVIDGPR